MAIQKVSFKSRDTNLSWFCPLCGTCNVDNEGTIESCDHLAYVHLNIAEPPLMYCRDDLASVIDEESDFITDDQLTDAGLEDALIIEEVTPGPSICEMQVCYRYSDDA